MIQRVDTVLIGKKVNIKAAESNTWATAFAEGDVAIFDENREAIADASNASTLYVGVFGKEVEAVKKDGTIQKTRIVEFSNPIKKDSKPHMIASVHSNPEQQEVTIDFTDASIVAGNRYVLRIVYKDIEGAPGQFTHTYEHYATSSDATDLIEALRKKINKHANRRVVVSEGSSDMIIKLTAMPKTDNEGVNSINEYSVVDMAVTMYVTEPGQLLNNVPEEFGVTVNNHSKNANPGVGYWKQVRDQEVRNMGYKGLVYTGTFPEMKQDMKTVEGTLYDVITIENDNLYLSNDNQYIKTTPMVAEVYVPTSGALVTALKKFNGMTVIKDTVSSAA